GFGAEVVDLAAVVADRGVHGAGEPGRAEPGERAAPAVADNADPAPDPCDAGGGGDVHQRRVPAEPAPDLAPADDVVAAVAEFDPALDPVEQRRRHDEDTVAREA